MKNTETRTNVKYVKGRFLLFVSVFAAIIIGVTVFYYNNYRAAIEKEKKDLITSIAKFKVDQVETWRDERLQSADFLLHSPVLAICLTRLAVDPADRESSALLKKWLESYLSDNHYKAAYLADASGRILLAAGKAGGALCPEAMAAIRSPAALTGAVMGDLHRSPAGEIGIHSAGLASRAPSGRKIFLVTSYDPAAYLYPLIQTWPTNSPTAETLLVRGEGDDVVFLNELRHRKNTALNFRLPASDTDLPAATAVRGSRGVMRGVDYRGKRVLAYMAPIPGFNWMLVAKIDEEEVFADLRRTSALLLLLVIAALAAAGGGTFILFRAQISAREKVQEDLSRLDERATLAARAAGLGIWDWDLVNDRLVWDDRMHELYGVRKEDLPAVYEAWCKALHPDDRARSEAEFKKALSGEKAYDAEFRVVWPNGTVRHLKAIAEVLKDASGKPLRMLGVNLDITERKRADEALREREAQLQQLFEGMATCVAVYRAVSDGGDFIIKDFNPAAERASKAVRAEIVGRRILDVFPGAKQIGVFDALERAWRTGEPQFLPVTLYKDARMSQWVENHIFRTPAGDLVAMYEDVTVRKQAEEDLKTLNAQLEQRVAERTTQLENSNKELEAFAYSVSHDLRAPLRAIDGFSLALLEDCKDKLDAAGKEDLHRVRSGAQRMGALIDDLLKLSQISRTEVSRQSVDLSALARAVTEELRKEQPDRAVDCVIQDGIVAEGDEQLLRIAFENLFTNAWKFTGKQPKAKVEFGATPSGAETAFFVRDNGAGFDMKYTGKLFSAFQRMHTTTDFPGTGIGLATVQRIVARHGGRIWAEASPGKGAEFFFTLGKTKEAEYDRGEHTACRR